MGTPKLIRNLNTVLDARWELDGGEIYLADSLLQILTVSDEAMVLEARRALTLAVSKLPSLLGVGERLVRCHEAGCDVGPLISELRGFLQEAGVL